ncbi:MAG: hypothetical protein ACM3ZC_08000 [Bacteroidota bacterium]
MVRSWRPRRAVLTPILAAGIFLAAQTVLPAAGGPATTPAPSGVHKANGIWISSAEIAARPMSGPTWDSIKRIADMASFGPAQVGNQDSRHDLMTYACALVAVRTGDKVYRDRALAACMAAIDTDELPDKDCKCAPSKGRALGVARNFLCYIIAADLLGLRADGDPKSDGSRFQAWVEKLRFKANCPNIDPCEEWNWLNLSQTHDSAGSNANAQAGACRIAAALYLGDKVELARAWDTFRRYSGDRSVGPAGMTFNENGYTWSHDPSKPVAVNPKGATKDGHRIDGAVINDQGRGGAFTWPPAYTQYPWVGLEGYIAQAYMLHRAGYPALEVQDKAPLRAVEYQWYLYKETGNKAWWDRTYWVQHLTKAIYPEAAFEIWQPAGSGFIMGYTDWTHGS